MISIAIPDSMFLDDDSLKDKTIKVGQIARAAAIFGVERIYIYRDISKNHESDYQIAKSVFEYAETPQYLRKRLIPKRKELEYVGLLPPLRTPHHLKDALPMVDELREAVIFSQGGELLADIGTRQSARIEGRWQEGQRITVRVLSLSPLTVRVSPKAVGTYWGYEIRRAPSLGRFLRSAPFELVILTSRLGRNLEGDWVDFCGKCARAPKILVCFGSPDSGVDKMLRQDNSSILDFKALYLNMFPNQNTETIRLEEAILGSLSILNIARKLTSET